MEISTSDLDLFGSMYVRGKSATKTAAPRLLLSIINSSTNASLAVFSCESVAVVRKSGGLIIPE